MEFQRVDKKAKTKWRFSRIMALILLVIPIAAVVVFMFYVSDDGRAGLPAEQSCCFRCFR